MGGFCPYHGKDYEIYFFYTGTGLQIPPAAQQALQMSGSLAFGAVAGRNWISSNLKSLFFHLIRKFAKFLHLKGLTENSIHKYFLACKFKGNGDIDWKYSLIIIGYQGIFFFEYYILFFSLNCLLDLFKYMTFLKHHCFKKCFFVMVELRKLSGAFKSSFI